MIEVLKAILLGIVQGLAEFLPVSSSGHLIVFKKLFNMDPANYGLSFDIALHFATLIAVCFVLWKEIWPLIKNPIQKYVLWIIVATIPAVLVGMFFDDYIEEFSQSGGFLVPCFLITAAILWFSESIGRKTKDKDDITLKDSVIIGCTQAVAVMPGISRSGSTLSAGLFCGLKKDVAITFSFMMAIPIIAGSAVLGVKDVIDDPASIQVVPTICGMIAALISGFLAVKFMIKFFKKHSVKGFAIYVAVLAVLILVDQLFFQQFFDTFLVFSMK